MEVSLKKLIQKKLQKSIMNSLGIKIVMRN